MLEVKPNYNLQPFNTLAVPATAEFYSACQSVEDIRAALDWSRLQRKPVHILGGGSNVILPQELKGLTVQPALKGIEIIREDSEYVFVQVAAGENWHKLVEYCVSRGCFGIENLAYIPGLAGAAPIQNIGAYGVELQDVLYSLTAIEISNGEERQFSAADCEFSYRESVFKKGLANCYFITSIVLRLSRAAQCRAEYPALDQFLLNNSLNPTPANVMRAVVSIRKAKLPEPKEIPNAGSFFKNPVVDLEEYTRLKSRFPNLVSYSVSPQERKLAAAWLIDSLGLKGKNFNGVGVHQDQALVITNPERLPGEKILALAHKISDAVKNKFGISLDIEPRIL